MNNLLVSLTLGLVAGMASFPPCLLAQPVGDSAAGDQLAAQQSDGRPNAVPPKVLAFYYPWYGNPQVEAGSGQNSHWSGIDEAQRRIANSTNYPSLGPYDSHNAELIAKHCAWARQSGVDGFIASWWGHGTFEDRAMQPLLEGCRRGGLQVSVYYERVPDPKNADSATRDILNLLNRYARHPAWLTVHGKPVIFIYGRAVGDIGVATWSRVVAQVNKKYAGGVLFMGDRTDATAARAFGGIHTYNTAAALKNKALPEIRSWAAATYPSWTKTARQFQRISAITVIPGYDDTKIRKPGLRVDRMDGASYRAQWEAAIAADPDWVLITSWNEWHEGSEIEPSIEHGEKYLRLTAEFAARFKNNRKAKR